MAKAAKSDRQKVIDDIKKKQKGAEKRRGMMIVGVCVVIALLIVGAAAYRPVKDWWDLRQFNDVDLASIGAPASVCGDITKKAAEGEQRPPDHRGADHLRGRAAGVRPALERRRRRPRADRQAVLHRGRPPRARVARAQPRARLHDPLVRRDDRRRRRQADRDRGHRQEARRERQQLPVQVHRRARGRPTTSRRARRSRRVSTSRSRTGEARRQAAEGIWQYCSEPSGEALADVHEGLPLHRLARAERDCRRRRR